MNRALTEFIGAFFLVLTICLAVTNGGALAPLAIGLALMVMVYMGGHVSGAHYNPAVTLAVFLRGKLPAADVPMYMIAQILGGIAAAMLGCYLANGAVPIHPGANVDVVRALVVEVLCTFALALVVLQSATCDKTVGNSFYGLAIGMTVAASAFGGGAVSGGAFNPAVGIGLTVNDALFNAQTGGWADIWLYIVGPLVGGALAAAVFRFQNGPDEAPAA